MKKYVGALLTGCLAAGFSVAAQLSAAASMNLEADSSVAGFSLALNNFYAGNMEPEKELARILSTDAVLADTAELKKADEVPQVTSARSEYENVAISRVSDYVNVRKEANTTSEVVGKIYNNCAATILSTVDGEGGAWYQIRSGTVQGYIKAEYFITGEEAEAVAKKVGKMYATVVNTSSLRLREAPDANSKTLTLLAEGASYVVLEEKDNYAKLQIDVDLEGYVSEEYLEITVEFDKAVSLEEERAEAAEDARLKKEADDAIEKLEQVKKAAALEAPKAKETTAAAKQTAPKETEPATIAANPVKGAPEGGKEAPTQAPVKKETEGEKETKAKAPTKDPDGGKSLTAGSGPSGEVASATRTAMVAYAKQFLGNPYVYGGTSLTNGADCSGFTQAVYAHFGISIGRSSRDQAAGGTVIDWKSAQPGDLLFYASGDTINHVALYIGGGQVIHASTPTTGIVITAANYRTPCKAVSYMK